MPAPEAGVILRHIADALVMLDRDGRITYTNESFCAMVGRRGQDLRGLRWSDLLDAATSARLDPVISPALMDGHVHFNLDRCAPGDAGGTYCLTTSEVRDAAGAAVGVLQNFRSTDRLRDMLLDPTDVDAALQREKDRTDEVLDLIADGVFTVDRELTLRSFSAKMERLTGMAAASVAGQQCRDVLRGSKCGSDCPLEWSLGHGLPVDRCHETFRLADGRVVPVTVTTTLLRDAKGTVVGLTGVVRDDTELEHLRRELHARDRGHDLVGNSPEVRALRAAIETLASNDASVLITGETGTGTDIVALAIHHGSARRDRPFVSVNCAALHDKLLESELFGHVRGAFTGAIHDKAGRFEVASGGTILLDEIGATTPAFQARLLRVLQDKTFERVGDTGSRRTDVRVIAASNRDLRQLTHDRLFREDLYRRLAVVPIHVAPLRSRQQDIPLLVEHFIEKYRPRYFGPQRQFAGISHRALALLMDYPWPGNIRELEHAIEYAMIATTTGRIERAFLPAPIRHAGLGSAESGLPPAEPPDEAQTLKAALEAHRWNASETAKTLGISRTTHWRRMRRFGLLSQRSAPTVRLKAK